MKKIGGIFPIQKAKETENHFFENICPQNGELKFLLSGRCAIYYALEDIKASCEKKVAYLPLYTCETVVAPFKKAGFQLMFYSLSKNMTPIFQDEVLDKIGVISICGYFGFSDFDRNFIKKCKSKGIIIIEDTTHSILSADGIDESCDYVVGSLRKWMGVASGGFAIKNSGKFNLPLKKIHDQHLELRKLSIKNDDIDTFWEAEMLLREIFDSYESDEESVYIMKHADFSEISAKRRENYEYLLNHFKSTPKIKVVFDSLPMGTVPSHFTLFCEERENIQAHLANLDIKTSVFWPVGPYINLDGEEDTKYIYDHVLSITCDQRFDTADMQRICDGLNSYN
ncbi:MAG: DegT/DnrJ/EryC1/StrS aminotransferase [Oscillospiraceae bacterium]